MMSSNLTERIALQGAMLVEASCWGAPWAHQTEKYGFLYC